MAEIDAKLCGSRIVPYGVDSAESTITVYPTAGSTHARRAWIGGFAIVKEVCVRGHLVATRIGLGRRWKNTITDHVLGHDRLLAWWTWNHWTCG